MLTEFARKPNLYSLALLAHCKTQITVNGEYYVTLPYNLMIDDKLNVTHYITDNFVCLGTPSDVICFESWKNIFKYNNITEDNYKLLYNYWNNYVS